MDEIQLKALKALLSVAYTAFHLADDAMENPGLAIVVDSGDMSRMNAALCILETLPDDRPGYAMNGPMKAEWALRALLTDCQPGKAAGSELDSPGLALAIFKYLSQCTVLDPATAMRAARHIVKLQPWVSEFATEQERFESWAITNSIHSFDLSRHPVFPSNYSNDATQWAFIGWLARSDLTPPSPPTR